MQNPLVPVGDLLTDEAGPEIFDSLKDSQGRFRTQSLFWETRHESYPAHFTTKQRAIERDGVTYVSMYEKPTLFLPMRLYAKPTSPRRGLTH